MIYFHLFSSFIFFTTNEEKIQYLQDWASAGKARLASSEE